MSKITQKITPHKHSTTVCQVKPSQASDAFHLSLKLAVKKVMKNPKRKKKRLGDRVNRDRANQKKQKKTKKAGGEGDRLFFNSSLSLQLKDCVYQAPLQLGTADSVQHTTRADKQQQQ